MRAAALHLFAEVGYAAASMRQLADRVNIRASALYHYWPTKQHLLVDLLERHMSELLEAWASVEAGLSANPVERLDAFARFHIHYHLERPDEVFLSYMELRSLEPENFTRIEEQRRRYERILSTIIAKGVQARAMHAPEPHVAAMAIIAMLTGVNTWYREGGRLSRSEVEDIYAEMARAVVGAAAGVGTKTSAPNGAQKIGAA